MNFVVVGAYIPLSYMQSDFKIDSIEMTADYSKTFKTYINQNRIVSFDKVDHAMSFFTEESFKKGAHFNVRHGKDEYMAFLQRGLVVYYIFSGEAKQTIDLLYEGDWVALFDNTKPSQVNIEFLEDSKLWIITEEKICELSEIYPSIAIFKAKVIHQYLATMTERTIERTMLDGRARLVKYTVQNPTALMRVPNFILSSFLGLQPQSLSRIKRTLK